jgi:hypothetical protein
MVAVVRGLRLALQASSVEAGAPVEPSRAG